MEQPQEGIWIIDASAQTVFCNDSMADILGTTAPEMIGQPSFTYVFPEDVGAAGLLFGSKKRGDSNPFRFKLRRQDGSGIWVDVQGSPTFDAAGEFTGIAGKFTVCE